MEDKNKEVKKEEKKVKEVKETKTEPKKEVEKKVEKKAEPKKNEAKKKVEQKKKKTWIPVTLVIVLLLVAVLTVMIITSSSPKKSIDGFLTNLKAGEFKTANEFLNTNPAVEEETVKTDLSKNLFDKMTWKVKKVTTEDDKATVELEVTTKDFKALMDEYLKKAVKMALGTEQMTEEQSENLLLEEVKKEDVKMTTVTKNITVIKENKKWKVLEDENLRDAILPGLQETIEAFN